jgi:hypothetical protein
VLIAIVLGVAVCCGVALARACAHCAIGQAQAAAPAAQSAARGDSSLRHGPVAAEALLHEKNAGPFLYPWLGHLLVFRSQ